MSARKTTRPAGQSLIELVLLLGVFSAFLVAVMMIGVVGNAAIKTTHAARFAAFDCDSRPGYCRDGFRQTESKLRSAVVYSDRHEVFPNDSPQWANMKSLGPNAAVLEKSSDVALGVDLPRVDGADKGLLQKLSEAFRRFGMKAGPAIFSLPSPDQLIRSTVHTTLWGSHSQRSGTPEMPSIAITGRLALISDAWAASDRTDFTDRVRKGESPLSLIGAAVDGLYIPGKDILMPALDLLGLESNTQAFRKGFHRVDHDIPYANSRVRIP